MAFDAFLKLDGIKGEGPGGAITLESFSWGVSNTSSSATGGAGSGKAVFQDFSFASVAGSEAADLFMAAAQGKSIRSGQLLISDKTRPLITITFNEVLISSYKLHEGPTIKLGDGSVRSMTPLAAPVNEVSFNFLKFTFQAGTVASGDVTNGTIG